MIVPVLSNKKVSTSDISPEHPILNHHFTIQPSLMAVQ